MANGDAVLESSTMYWTLVHSPLSEDVMHVHVVDVTLSAGPGLIAIFESEWVNACATVQM